MKLDLLNRQRNGTTKMFISLSKDEFMELKRLLHNYVLLTRLDKIKTKYGEQSNVYKVSHSFFKSLAKNLKSEFIIKQLDDPKVKTFKLHVLTSSHKVVSEDENILYSIITLFHNNIGVKITECTSNKFIAEFGVL